jgi:hypothetical protein
MSSVSEFFPSNYLKAADIKGKTIKAVIEGWDVADFGEGNKKPAIMFVGKEKGLVLNKTNATAIADEFGDDMDEWAGKPVEISTIKTRNKEGKVVDGLCVTPDKAPAKAGKKKAEPVAEAVDEDDDSISF